MQDRKLYDYEKEYEESLATVFVEDDPDKDYDVELSLQDVIQHVNIAQGVTLIKPLVLNQLKNIIHASALAVPALAVPNMLGNGAMLGRAAGVMGPLGLLGAVGAAIGMGGLGLQKKVKEAEERPEKKREESPEERLEKLSNTQKKRIAHQLVVLVQDAQKESYSGKKIFSQISENRQKRFRYRAQEEARLKAGDDFQDVVRNQIVSWEHLLREMFLTDSDRLLDSILAGAKPNEAMILKKHFQSNQRHTMFVVEVWVRCLRRQLQKQDPTLSKWVNSSFAKHCRRYSHEKTQVLQMLARRKDNLPYFIENFRKHRNPLMHRDDREVTLKDYQEWCDFVYGTSSLLQWMDVGVNPTLYQPHNFGWISYLATARAQHLEKQSNAETEK